MGKRQWVMCERDFDNMTSVFAENPLIRTIEERIDNYIDRTRMMRGMVGLPTEGGG